jgi:transposase
MQDRQLYAQILGIEEPWRVERVELQVEQRAVHIYLEHREGVRWRCAECGREVALYDHQAEREWRHLDTCQYRTILHAAPPRAQCAEHGVRVVKLPWAEAGSRFTMLFERLAIDWLRAASQTAVAGLLQLSWDEIHRIMDRAVERGLRRRPAAPIGALGVDETSFAKGHQYVTVVNDLEKSQVLYVAEDRKQASLDGFWGTLTEEQKHSIRAVAVDMWDPYVASLREHLPGADEKIVFDKFHIAGHLGGAVDKVRRAENKVLREQGDQRLVGTKYDWLRHPSGFSREDWREFAALRQSNLKTARAWALKETAMQLFDYRSEGFFRTQFRRWYYWATHSRLPPMMQVAKMLQGRFANIVTYLKHRITNAASESLNAKIQWVKYTARGFRNKANFTTAIYFHCGGLDLGPGTH